LQALGRLVIALACGAPFSQAHLPASLRLISTNFSEDIYNLIRYPWLSLSSALRAVCFEL
jgi:hypothetical protein